VCKPAASPAACWKVEWLAEARATGGVVTSQEQAETGNQKTERVAVLRKPKPLAQLPWKEVVRQTGEGGGVETAEG